MTGDQGGEDKGRGHVGEPAACHRFHTPPPARYNAPRKNATTCQIFQNLNVSLWPAGFRDEDGPASSEPGGGAAAAGAGSPPVGTW